MNASDHARPRAAAAPVAGDVTRARDHRPRQRAARTTRAAAAAVLSLAVGAIAVAWTSTTARAEPAGNQVIEWNAIASTALIATAGQSPQASVLGLAMVQGAVYDAVNAIDGGHQPYLVKPEARRGDSKQAAAATAAYRVLVGFPERTPALVGLVPTQVSTLQPLYTAAIATLPGGSATDDGIAIGEATAAAMLTARTGDGRGGSFTFVPGTQPGQWRLGPPQGPAGVVARDPAPWVGFVRPFLLPDAAMVRSDGPNALTSAAYAADFNEVKEVGSLTSTTRTADQTAAAIFWQDSGPAIWNRVVRALAADHGLGVTSSARLFAMTGLSAADAAIGCWNSKAYWNAWRPITAIREAASDGNPATVADPTWVPLFDPSVPVSGAPLVTPGFPENPSGHTCVSSAVVGALHGFFGTDRISFTANSNKCAPAPCPARRFTRLSAALKEVINARVWGGIHFRTADVQGAVLGHKVVHYMRRHFFRPVS